MTADKRVDAEIDALLGRDETTSVIDTLLAMPRVEAANDPDGSWERVLHARLQARLARKMRRVLEEAPDRKGSRSAA
ncbi:hypothetical protein [Chelativorans alearense]|uniref:hypothetical protein n=1 Tax=Chelativorans alearense TaxID=2681495 RepID=UPI0013D33272|nr:hypothetical protein [Chelativorans alearense]